MLWDRYLQHSILMNAVMRAEDYLVSLRLTYDPWNEIYSYSTISITGWRGFTVNAFSSASSIIESSREFQYLSTVPIKNRLNVFCVKIRNFEKAVFGINNCVCVNFHFLFGLISLKRGRWWNLPIKILFSAHDFIHPDIQRSRPGFYD